MKVLSTCTENATYQSSSQQHALEWFERAFHFFSHFHVSIFHYSFTFLVMSPAVKSPFPSSVRSPSLMASTMSYVRDSLHNLISKIEILNEKNLQERLSKITVFMTHS